MFDTISKPSLAEIIQWGGISPVPDIVLNQHKQAEIDKHPASWLYDNRRRSHVRLCLFGMIVMATCCIPLLKHVPQGIWRDFVGLSWSVFVICNLGALLTIGVMKIVGPARWEERFVRQYQLPPMPEELKTLAFDTLRTVNRTGQHAWFVVGELKQDLIQLDPYVLVRTRQGLGYAQVCVGVWDGRTIIHQAQRAP